MPNATSKYALTLTFLIALSCHTFGQMPGKVSARASLREPLVGEAEDLPGAMTGFPDPFPLRWGDHFYLCHSVIDLDNARMYRTKTFDRNDLTRFPLSFDFGKVRHVRQIWGFKPYRHTDGTYHAYGSVHYGRYKTEVVHFVPQEGEAWTANRPIQKWRLDRILVGKQQLGGRLAYDGYVLRDDEDTLFLIVNETIDRRNYITARRMLDPHTLDPAFERRILLGPENYRSEDLPWNLRLTEGTFIEKIQGKYVLIYSVGFYGDGSYKVGAAFSDTLIPPERAWYKKVLIPDPNNVWGNSATEGKEVKYLLQTEHEDWPNYAGRFVNGPGIGSLVTLESGEHLLIFAARRAGEVDRTGQGRYAWKAPVVFDFLNKDMSNWITIDFGGDKKEQSDVNAYDRGFQTPIKPRPLVAP